MVIRTWALVMAISGLLVFSGCGDDSGDESPRAGSSAGGTGAPKAGSGAGKLTPMMAIAGACENQEDLSMCMGLEEFMSCTLGTCGLQPCLDNACKDYLTCLEGAADPCTNNCTRTAACETCIEDIPDCVVAMCLKELDC